MHIITKRRLREFWEGHRDAQGALEDWIAVVRQARWQNLAEVRQVYPHADPVGNCTVFNIRGNNYRLITKMHYREQTVLIRSILTHKEYDEEGWKNDCNS